MEAAELDRTFPFRSTAQERLNQTNQDILYADETRELAVERVQAALADGQTFSTDSDEPPLLTELASYALARILVTLIDDYRVTSTYAEGEAERMHECVQGVFKQADIDDVFDSVRKEGVRSLGTLNDLTDLSIEAVSSERFRDTRYDSILSDASPVDNPIAGTIQSEIDAADNVYKLPVANALTVEPYFSSERKLADFVVSSGYVFLPERDALDLVYEALEQEVQDNLPLPLPDKQAEEFREQFQPELDAITIPDSMTSIDVGDLPVHESLFPPSIKKLVEMWRSGRLQNHDLRVVLAAFLLKIGMTVDEIVDFLKVKDAPDGVEDLTRYHVNHISDNDYMPANFTRMESFGLTWQKDELEKAVDNPLPYYQIKLDDADIADTDEDEEDDSGGAHDTDGTSEGSNTDSQEKSDGD